jgi:hypothetical protein
VIARSAINNLNDDEVVDVIAMAWLGRGDFDKAGWKEARVLANQRHRHQSAAYLAGMPGLGDYIEDGLCQLGYSCGDCEIDRL